MTWVAAATLAVGAYSANQQAQAAKGAANAQEKASKASIAEQRAQAQAMQELLQPYVQAGQPAMQEQMALLGFSLEQPKFGGDLFSAVGGAAAPPSYVSGEAGAEAQRAAIERISSSPMLQAQMQSSEAALLQNASATGGLRGGNVKGALAQFRPSMLNQAIQQRYANLAGMTALGQQSAAGVGTAGIQTGQGISGQLGQIGAAQAGSVLAQGQAQQQMLNTIPQAIGTYYGMTGQSPLAGSATTATPVRGSAATPVAQPAAAPATTGF